MTVTYVGPRITIYVGPSLIPQKPGIPRNMTEFCAMYYGKIKQQVSGFPGIAYDDVEDATQEIVFQFIAGNYLNVYSAEKQTAYANVRYQNLLKKYRAGELEYLPERHVGKFSSFVFEFTRLRLMGRRDKTNRIVATMRSLDNFVETTGDHEEGEASLLTVFGADDNEYVNLEVRQLLKRVYVHLANVTTPTNTRNFPELLKCLVNDSMDNESGLDREAYAARKGITVSAVSMQMRELRLYLEQAGLYRDLKELTSKRHRSKRA